MLKREQPTAILAADLHIREDVPLCRTDDFFQAQETKLCWLCKLQERLDCPLIIAGDIYDHWKPSPFLLGWSLKVLPQFYAVAGQHDLPQHRLGLLHKSGFYVLQKADKLKLLKGSRKPKNGETEKRTFSVLSDRTEAATRCYGYSYGETLRNPEPETGRRTMAVAHRLVWKTILPYPGCTAESAKQLLKKHPYDLIVTGDNHKPFVEKYRGRLLVNPGSMMRMDADQVTHKPRVYLWYAKSNTVERVYYPITEGVVSREHITKRKIQEEQFQVFVQRLQDMDTELGLSFKRNVKRFLHKNRTRKEVVDIIWEALS